MLLHWRTFGIVLIGLVLLFVGARFAPSNETYEIMKDGIEILVFLGACKSAVQHLAAGGGIKGAISSIVSAEKKQ